MVVVGMATVAARVFCLLDPTVSCTGAMADGSRVEAGAELLTLSGATRTLLRAERVALNLVQRLCGIATLTASFADQVAGTKAKIVDTRKTTPGLRMLEKYAVRSSGGHNHRYSLSDGVLIKDNHIAACGSITEAVQRVRSRVPHTINVEVETDTLAQVEECLACGVGVIMLDNMDLVTMRQAVATDQRPGPGRGLGRGQPADRARHCRNRSGHHLRRRSDPFGQGLRYRHGLEGLSRPAPPSLPFASYRPEGNIFVGVRQICEISPLRSR